MKVKAVARQLGALLFSGELEVPSCENITDTVRNWLREEVPRFKGVRGAPRIITQAPINVEYYGPCGEGSLQVWVDKLRR
jgi:hypothetical protein